MKLPTVRPEDRRLGGGVDRGAADGAAACLRSEAFAEDLLITGLPQTPADARARQSPGAGSHWRGRAALPLLGLALAAVLGALGH